MRDATFDEPDLATFTGLHHLGLLIIGQRLEPDCTVLACRLVHDLDAAEADPVVLALRLRRPPPRDR